MTKPPDTLITSGPLDDRSLLGSAIRSENRKLPPAGCQLSLVRILFYCQSRLEDLIYPVSQCNSWFVSLYFMLLTFSSRLSKSGITQQKAANPGVPRQRRRNSKV